MCASPAHKIVFQELHPIPFIPEYSCKYEESNVALRGAKLAVILFRADNAA
jgi:hypothetical protein